MMICLFSLVDPYCLQAEQHSAEFVGTVTSHVQMRYLLFTPKGDENSGGKKWPLIVYLHWASRLKEMPIWAFHGEKDNLVPFSDTQDLIDRLRALGNEVRFTVLSNRDHYILDAYEDQELYSWFLQHAKK